MNNANYDYQTIMSSNPSASFIVIFVHDLKEELIPIIMATEFIKQSLDETESKHTAELTDFNDIIQMQCQNMLACLNAALDYNSKQDKL